MIITRVIEAAGGSPGSARRVVQFRAGGGGSNGYLASRDQHLAVSQQRRGVRTSGTEAASDTPGPGRWVI